jgi:hypothetical protein
MPRLGEISRSQAAARRNPPKGHDYFIQRIDKQSASPSNP